MTLGLRLRNRHSTHLQQVLLLVWGVLFSFQVKAQINTDRMMIMGRNALYYEDYVLAIQRFNMVISSKPYLSEPYFFRALSKFYLEDYMGAEADCSEAVRVNPFLPNNYELRGLCRINLKHYEQAISDYNHLLAIEPKHENGWNNKVLCYMELKEYRQALAGLDTMITIWPGKAHLYTLKAEAYLLEKDTVSALAAVDEALAINSYQGTVWNVKAAILANRGDYKGAEEAMDKTIVQEPRVAAHYVNRAMIRFNRRNLRGALADYDAAIEHDSTHFVAHFNRALLRAQVGDDNRALLDFDFVIAREPDNAIALYNRALMRNNTGDYKGAVADLNQVFRQYPSFWAGYQMRAELYRKMGRVNDAERDEFRVLKAQMEKRYGKRTASRQKTRKSSSKNLDDYDKLIETDHALDETTPEYADQYRGKVQNRHSDEQAAPFVTLSYYPQAGRYNLPVFDDDLSHLNSQHGLVADVSLAFDEQKLTEKNVETEQAHIEMLTRELENNPQNAMCWLSRGLSYYAMADYEQALIDANQALQIDATLLWASWLKVQVCLKLYELNKDGLYDKMALQAAGKVLADAPDKWSAHYNMAYIYMMQHNWQGALEELDKAAQLNAGVGQIFFNRALVHAKLEQWQQAMQDLSVAGQHGQYKAYNLMKQYARKIMKSR